ncbi:ATP-binding protein [Hydrogenophaga palleronii]|uniref:ATP-binding protein n=1 Tax=Hydrogenophaga palleronii TaxID=65655 RepID=UPI0008261004|nr:ATP-binding protein [Hydrogenophaga palleronii]
MRTICLQTNQNRLIANLRHAFNQGSMLGELLQNARRAQAGAIHFTVEDNSLTIRDDGSGITDLQTLIHIAESGWDEQTQTRENAFGMGVLSTLYFAERLTVRSDGKAFSAATAAIIRGEPIQVFPCDLVVGTEIRLDGIQPTQPGETLFVWADRLLRTLCEAFPVPVWLNGHEVLRPLADPALQWRETPMGKILLDLSAPRTQWRCFLQGLPIGRSPSICRHQVIRLPAATLARLPDRQHLLNEAEDHKHIQAAVDGAYRQALTEKKERLSASDFVVHFARICVDSSNADLLNDVPFVPRAWFRSWALEPAGFRHYWDRHVSEGIVAREVLEETGAWRIESKGDDEPTAEVYLEARKAFLVEESGIDGGHWLLGLVRPIAPEDVHVRPGSILHRDDSLCLADYEVGLALADSLYVSIDGEPEVAVGAIRKGVTLFLTADAGNVTSLVSDYIFDDRYDEDREDEDGRTIDTFIAVGCSQSPAGVVQALLPNTLRYSTQPKLAGAVVQLTFDAEGKLAAVTA